MVKSLGGVISQTDAAFVFVQFQPGVLTPLIGRRGGLFLFRVAAAAAALAAGID